MRLTILLLLSVFSIANVNSQNENTFWRDISFPSKIELRQETVPDKYRSLQINIPALQRALENTPNINNRNTKSGKLLTIPTPDGKTTRFELYQHSVFEKGLADKYPDIKSYRGVNPNNKAEKIRIIISPKKTTFLLKTANGPAYIIPATIDEDEKYMAYYRKDNPASGLPFVCGVTQEELEKYKKLRAEIPSVFRNQGAITLREYRVAFACTGEWGQRRGSVQNCLTDMNIALNVLNEVYENDLSIKFVLVANNDKVIFLNPNTDPYNNSNVGGALLGQNSAVLNDSIGVSNYDVGHIITNGCTDVGGIAGGPACDNGTKGRGVTCQAGDLIDAFESITTHEMGHQFSAGHTWNNCPPTLENSPNQFHPGSAFEPGSGSTIMSYAGLCGNQNIAFDNDVYFHAGSIKEILFFSRQGTGNACPNKINTENVEPEISLPYSNDFSIPISTPFELTASATDANNDNLTYTWDEFDLGPIANIGEQNVGTSPLFRSYLPTNNPTRIFPKIETILSNSFDNAEVLPTYSRDMKFRFIVRDNFEGSGAVVHQELKFKATDKAGPFLVEFPNASTDFLEVGQYAEIKWDVANTNKSPVNCQKVNILLSLDGGFTYPITLLADTPNDGSEFIVIPNNTTGTARVKIAAADNIFFDISNENFVIAPPSKPGYALTATPRDQQVCLPDNAVIELVTSSLLSYDSLISFAVLSGLPEGATASFSNNPVTPSENSNLTIDMAGVTEEASFSIVLQAIAPSADTSYRTIVINTISNDFSDFAITNPADGSSGVSSLPTFSWEESLAADEYEIEIATSPSFGNTNVINDVVSGGNFTPSEVLNENTLYYWRARPLNPCGNGAYSETFAFHTESLSCATFVADNVPLNISAQGTPTVESVLPITFDGTVNDVNIPILKGNHDLVKHLDVKLISPAGTSVLLFSNLCGNTSIFNIGIDDEAPTELPCPPNDQEVHQPQEALSAFDGENAKGDWKLQVVVNNTFGEGGALEKWSLELCSNVNLSNPFLVVNDTMPVNPNTSRAITDEFLLVDDDQNAASELQYTIVKTTQHGTIMLNGNPLGIGAQFTQSDIDNFSVRYQHDGSDTSTDKFSFTVNDGADGGWFGTTEFNIVIDPDVMISTKDVLAEDFIQLFPNPASEQITISFSKKINEDIQFRVFNVEGQLLMQIEKHQFDQQFDLAIDQLVAGLYILQLNTKDGVLNKRFLVQR
ncbi:MAG TPA: T9SS type A sorting domain-containing protein [Saprospiraceae bacterium]|nr:T9SS type A sorting domain-containing protein [Saprospiraceae bacterium]